MLSRPFLLSFLFSGHCLFLSAQSDLVQRFTTDNGLPSNGIKGLEWDERTDFLWIATEAGVTRYNGADFRTFSKINTPELFSERMLLMQKNRAGRIYTVDEAGNIFFIMQNRLQFVFHVKLDTRASTARLIGLAASGRLFRQSAAQPPEHFGYNCSTDLPIPVSDEHIIFYHTDTTNGLAAGLYDYIAGKKDPLLIHAIEPGSKVFRLGDKIFVFTKEHVFYRIDPDMPGNHIEKPVLLGFDRSLLKTPAEGQERLFWENGMANPILVAGSRAWVLEFAGQQLVLRLISTAIPTDAPIYFAQYVEKNGMLFLGTASKGLLVIRKPQVSIVKMDHPAIDRNTAYYSQIALSNGSVLTSQGQVLGGAAPPPSDLPVKTSFNNFVLLTTDSVLWYSQDNVIYGYTYRTRQTVSYDAGPGSITTGFIRSGDKLWLANAVGIGVLQDGKINYAYRYPRPDINSNVPFAIQELAPGSLAIATCMGLLRFDTRSGRLDTMLYIPGTCVRALWKYNDFLFIGTYGKGIFLWKDGVMRSIPVDKNNYLQYAHCFVPDRMGFCWISSNKGLFRARPEDMVNAFEKNVPEIYYHYYGQQDGMDITELNGGCTPCALAMNDSILSFPSMDGLVWVNPSRAPIQTHREDIYIDELHADSTRTDISSLVTPRLPSNTRELTFMLSFPAWVNKENLYIEYKLEPYSSKWQSLEMLNNPTLHFSNLPSGDYRLLIRKLNGFGGENFSYKETSFRIMAHWYQQPWIWLLGLCCLTALIMWIVQLRTKHLQKRQYKLRREIDEKTNELKIKNAELERTDQIKTRLISIISHDLVTPLKFLHLAGKNLIEKKSDLSEQLQVETVTEMMNTAKELELLSTNILNWIKYRNEDRRLAKENFNPYQLTGLLFGIFNSMAKQKGIRLINRVDEQLVLFQFIEPVKIVLYNLILNGINFTQEGHILVSSSMAQDGVSLIIKDTGVGMTAEQITNIMADHFIISSANVDNRKGNGLGYLIIKDLLKIIRGSLSIHSEKGKGTLVTIRLPV